MISRGSTSSSSRKRRKKRRRCSTVANTCSPRCCWFLGFQPSKIGKSIRINTDLHIISHGQRLMLQLRHLRVLISVSGGFKSLHVEEKWEDWDLCVRDADRTIPLSVLGGKKLDSKTTWEEAGMKKNKGRWEGIETSTGCAEGGMWGDQTSPTRPSTASANTQIWRLRQLQSHPQPAITDHTWHLPLCALRAPQEELEDPPQLQEGRKDPSHTVSVAPHSEKYQFS